MMSKEKTYTVSKPQRCELKIRRSSFIGSIAPVVDRQSAEDYIDSIRKTFQDATHNCFGYRIDRDVFRYYDDGEPANSAGKPILAMLDKYHLHQSALVVTRYFGGIKLGVGGLISAYGQCAEETIQKSTLRELIDYQKYELSYPYNLTRPIEHTIAKYRGKITDSIFEAAVTTFVSIPSEDRRKFENELGEAGSGRVDIKPLEG